MSNLYECPTPVSGYGEIDMPNVLDTVYKDNYHLVAIITWWQSSMGIVADLSSEKAPKTGR